MKLHEFKLLLLFVLLTAIFGLLLPGEVQAMAQVSGNLYRVDGGNYNPVRNLNIHYSSVDPSEQQYPDSGNISSDDNGHYGMNWLDCGRGTYTFAPDKVQDYGFWDQSNRVYNSGFGNDWNYTGQDYVWKADVDAWHGGTTCNGQNSQVTINWNPNRTYTEYRIWREGGSEASGFISDSLSGDARSWTDTTARPNTSYIYWVWARNNGRGDTWSNYGEPIGVTTPDCIPTNPPMVFIDLFGGNDSPGEPITTTAKPNGLGINMLNRNFVKIAWPIENFPNYVQGKPTVFRVLASRVDGGSMSNSCAPDQLTTISVAGQSIPVCKLYERVLGPSNSFQVFWQQARSAVTDYYVWNEAVRADDQVGCSGAQFYYPGMTESSPVRVGDNYYYYCGSGSNYLVSTAQTQPVVVKNTEPRDAPTCLNPSGNSGLDLTSGISVDYKNPIVVRPNISKSLSFGQESFDLIGVAFVEEQVDGNFHSREFPRLIEQIAGGRGFVMVYTNRPVDVYNQNFGSVRLLGNQYYVYYNNGWQLIPNNSCLYLPGITFGNKDLGGTPFNPTFLVHFEAALGSKKWVTYDISKNFDLEIRK